MLACAAAFGLNAADNVLVDGLLYEPVAGGTAILKPNNYTGDIVVPPTVTIENVEYTVTEIASSAFIQVTSVELPNTVTKIGSNVCMLNGNITSVKLGSGLREIGSFFTYNCTKLVEVYCYATEVPNILASTFQGGLPSTTLYVPAASLEAYKASAVWNKFKEILPIAGEEVAVTGITLDKEEYTGEEGGTFTLTATVAPEDATDKTVVWTSSDESVATVADGVVTLVAEGTAEISASCGGFTAICKVTVESAYVVVESIALDQASFVGAPGSTFQLTATVLPEDATDKTVDWFSDDESVATVDENGLVTLVAVGEATITASPISNDALTATCKITVSNNVGIEGIEAEDGVAEYFNMQGMRVVNPEKGQMVIVRKGGKTFKVVI